MKRDKQNIKYKKITVEIPLSTYLAMKEYCSRGVVGRFFYCNFINLAILEYLKK